MVEPPLASTHNLKPDPGRKVTPHLVVNEHFCMALAHRMELPVAEVAIYRTPRPVLVVRRFDRAVLQDDQGVQVRRLHIIDACQAADVPATYKYERNLGSGEHVRDIREGVRAWGDAFRLEDVTAFQLADFAKRCGIDRRLLQREAKRLAKLATTRAPEQAVALDYVDDGERAFAGRLRDFVIEQAAKLTKLASDAAKIKDEYL